MSDCPVWRSDNMFEERIIGMSVGWVNSVTVWLEAHFVFNNCQGKSLVLHRRAFKWQFLKLFFYVMGPSSDRNQVCVPGSLIGRLKRMKNVWDQKVILWSDVSIWLVLFVQNETNSVNGVQHWTSGLLFSLSDYMQLPLEPQKASCYLFIFSTYTVETCKHTLMCKIGRVTL